MSFTTQSNHYFASNSSLIRIELIITSQRINHQFKLIKKSPNGQTTKVDSLQEHSPASFLTGECIGLCKFLYFTTTFLPFWMSTPFWALLTF